MIHNQEGKKSLQREPKVIQMMESTGKDFFLKLIKI